MTDKNIAVSEALLAFTTFCQNKTTIGKVALVNGYKAAPFKGDFSPDILFIGEAPGTEESEYGLPFVGKAGQLLDTWLNTLNKERTYAVINVIPYMPVNVDLNILRKPTTNEIALHRPFVEQLITALNPKVIILLGRTAQEALFPGEKLERGTLVKKDNRIVAFIYHPAFYLRISSNGMHDWMQLLRLLDNHEKKDEI